MNLAARHRAGLGPASLVVVTLALTWACGSTPPSTTTDTSPVPGVLTQPSPQPTGIDPCSTAVSYVGAFVNQLGERLAQLRPLLTAEEFDSAATAAKVSGVSAILNSFDGVESRAAQCSQLAADATSIANLRNAARTSILGSAAASVSDEDSQRSAGTELFGLLPQVIAIGRHVSSVATSLGLADQVAAIPIASSEPLPPPEPTPTPPSPPPAGGTYGSAYFGPNTTVRIYTVTGSTPDAIVRSIEAHGPASDWLPGRAEAVTVARPVENVEFQPSGGDCRLVATAQPAVHVDFTITLPHWKPPRHPDPFTVAWWKDEIARVATHEHHHVDLWRAAAENMSKSVATSTCGNVTSHLLAIVRDTTKANCEFDLDEYGRALGLTLESCLTR